MSTSSFPSVAQFSTTESAYDILEVEPTCSLCELKASYNRLILLHHPDKATGTTGLFLKVQAAWKLVSTEDDRKRYDMTSNSGVFVCSETFPLSDFIVCDDDGGLSRPCRCGDNYQVCSIRKECGRIQCRPIFNVIFDLFQMPIFEISTQQRYSMPDY